MLAIPARRPRTIARLLTAAVALAGVLAMSVAAPVLVGVAHADDTAGWATYAAGAQWGGCPQPKTANPCLQDSANGTGSDWEIQTGSYPAGDGVLIACSTASGPVNGMNLFTQDVSNQARLQVISGGCGGAVAWAVFVGPYDPNAGAFTADPTIALTAGQSLSSYDLGSYAYDGHKVTKTAPPPPAAPTCVVSDAQLAAYARAAGFADGSGYQNRGLTWAVAVALAESAGNAAAVHHNSDDSYDLGLWQINDASHPDYDRGRLLTDPAYNAAAAASISNDGADWSAWSTFPASASRQLDRATAAVNAAQVPPAECSTSGSGGDGTGAGAGNGEGDPTAPDGTCTGWNPLTYVKCALRWAFVPGPEVQGRWAEVLDDVKGKPPTSVLLGGVTYVFAIVHGLTDGQNASGCNIYGTANDYAGCGIDAADGLPGVAGGQWNLLAVAASFVQDNSYAHDTYSVLEIGIYGAAFWAEWRRVASSFGGKG